MTFADDLLAEAGGEPIVYVVIGESDPFGRGAVQVFDGQFVVGLYDGDVRYVPGLARKGEMLTWDEAQPLLDYDYDTGCGLRDCHAVYAWTATRVLFVVEYDGATWISSAPRNPTGGIPRTYGNS